MLKKEMLVTVPHRSQNNVLIQQISKFVSLMNCFFNKEQEDLANLDLLKNMLEKQQPA